jgi:hypothetical protein
MSEIIIQWLTDTNDPAGWVSAIAAIAAAVIALIALGISIASARSASRSAKSAERQNELAIHQRRVDAFDDLQATFGEALNLLVKADEREKRFFAFARSCRMIDFLFEEHVYEHTQNLFRDFRKQSNYFTEAEYLRVKLMDLEDLDDLHEDKRRVQERLFQLKKDIADGKVNLVYEFELSCTLICDAITLHKPKSDQHFFPISFGYIKFEAKRLLKKLKGGPNE